MYRAIMTPSEHNRIVHIPREYWDKEVEVLVLPFSYPTVNKNIEGSAKNWQAFIEATYGSFAETPLERPEQGVYEQREAFS